MTGTIDSTCDFNGLTEAATITSGLLPASWTLSGAGPTVLAAAAAHGAKGVRYTSTGSASRLQYDFGSNQTARAVVMDFYFRILTMPATPLYIATIMSLASGGAAQADVRVNADRTVTIRNVTTGVGTSTETLSTNVWYRGAWKVVDSTNTQEFRVYTGEGTTNLFGSALTGAYSSALTRVASVGPSTSAAGGSVGFDTLRVANDHLDPFVSSPWARKTSGGLWQPCTAVRI